MPATAPFIIGMHCTGEDIRETLRVLLDELRSRFDEGKIRWGAVTGSGGRYFCRESNISFVNEATAVVEGAVAENPVCGSIIEIGGQSAKFITEFTPADKSRIKIAINSNCSAGTGSFLEEQAYRLKLKPEDFDIYAKKAGSIPRIAGRCSVFAKTDIIHHQQEGCPARGLSYGDWPTPWSGITGDLSCEIATQKSPSCSWEGWPIIRRFAMRLKRFSI